MENYKVGHWYRIFGEGVLITGYQPCQNQGRDGCIGCAGKATFVSDVYGDDTCCGKSGGELMNSEINMQLTNTRW